MSVPDLTVPLLLGAVLGGVLGGAAYATTEALFEDDPLGLKSGLRIKGLQERLFLKQEGEFEALNTKIKELNQKRSR